LIPVDFFEHSSSKSNQKTTILPNNDSELQSAEKDFEELKRDDSEGSGDAKATKQEDIEEG